MNQPQNPWQVGQPSQPLGPRPVSPQGPRPLGPQPIAPGPRPIRPGATGPQPIPLSDAGSPKVREKTREEEEEDKELSDDTVKALPPWLISTVTHLVLVIILALILIPMERSQKAMLDAEWSPFEGQQLEDDTSHVEVENPMPQEEQSPQEMEVVPDPVAAPPVLPITPISTIEAAVTPTDSPIGSLLMGRTEGMKAALIGKYGGSPDSERAVQMALAWLAKQQSKNNGSWRLDGPYSDGIGEANPSAATALALLAYQGNGHTHRKGKWKDVVAKGWDFLLFQQQDDGNFYADSFAQHQFYTHGLGTIAVCELYGMTRDPKFKEPAEKAIAFALKTQDLQKGGWRYRRGADGRSDDTDLSVTGWLVMGLQSARMAGLSVPQDSLRLIERYLDQNSAGSPHQYGYTINASPTPAMTAEGLLCRQYLGWPQNEPSLLMGADYLLSSHMPRWQGRDVYYWYYATQMMHHIEGERWTKWNNAMRDMVVANQVKSGPEMGSWDPNPNNSHQGGRLFETCLLVYILEVYYRHMPLYRSIK